MNHAIRKTLAVAALGMAAMTGSGAAQAGGVNWHIGINLPGVFYPPPPVYYPPPPVYYQPPPAYYQPPPRVYYQPAPIVYQRAPIYVQPAPRGHWREGRWRDEDRGDRGDRRGHGPRGYQDRNGDGRPDRYGY